MLKKNKESLVQGFLSVSLRIINVEVYTYSFSVAVVSVISAIVNRSNGGIWLVCKQNFIEYNHVKRD